MKRNVKRKENGITLIALVVTIVVLLILAGITINYVMGDNGIFKQASDAKLKTDIAKRQEMLEAAKTTIIIEGLGRFDSNKYFDYIENQGIIEDKETDVVDNENGIYDVTTKLGYIFEVELIPSQDNPTDAKIEYIGTAGRIAPIIKEIETSATSSSITAKAIVTRLGDGIVTYYYKLKTQADSEYKEITHVNSETGATVTEGIVAGTEYVIKVVAKNEVGETIDTAEIAATKVFVESITLNKQEEAVMVGKTVTLVATIKPDNATNKNVTWESSNEEIATVDENGVITGKKVGTATITVKATDGSNKTASCNITVLKEPTVAEIVGEMQTSNKTVEDENGNKVVIPGGFKVVPNGGTDTVSKVDYSYNGDGKPCVQDGIVVEDNEGNQFVWIPVGDIINKDGTTTTITFGRYTFDETDGTPMLQQNATNYSQTITIESYFQELTSTSGNKAAKNLGDFVTKTQANGGYYLGRYEASQGKDGKVDSQVNKAVWDSITQPNAATAAQEMYNSNYVESDLTNSYSWDTAIVFIQKYSGNSNYANKHPATSSSSNTGKSGDKVCNIYEIASNREEWSTEHSLKSGSPCVNRGGSYGYTNLYTGKRDSYHDDDTYETVSFRPLIYIK